MWVLITLTTLLLAWILHLTIFTRWRGPIYWFRWIRLLVQLYLERASQEKRVDNYDLSWTASYQDCGIEASPSEKDLEQPKPLITDRHEDEMCINGVDRSGRVVVAKISRLTHRRATVFLYVRDSHGTVYTLPNQPDTNQVNVSSEGWRGAGLTLTPVDPMRCWRLKFNGYMRRGAREKYITEGTEEEEKVERAARKKRGGHEGVKTKQEEEEGRRKGRGEEGGRKGRGGDKRGEEEGGRKGRGEEGGRKGREEEGGEVEEEDIVEVRLDFLWRSMARPVDLWETTSSWIMARSLAYRTLASLKALRSEEGEEYDQWGILHGHITVADQPSSLWYLRGPRRHRWGLAQSGGVGLQTFTYLNSGDLLALRGRSLAHSSKLGFATGYLQKASGFLLPVTWTDLDPKKIPADPTTSTSGQHLLIKFTAGGEQHEVWQQLDQRVTFCTGDPWVTSHDLYPTRVATNHSYGWGVTIFSRRYTDLCPVPEQESLPDVFVPRVDLEDGGAPLVVTLDDPRCRNVDLAGGKGASLALLGAYKELIDPDQEPYEVPVGVVVTAAGWSRQLEAHTELQQAVRAVRQAATLAPQASLRDACGRAVEVCQGSKVCDLVAEALTEAILDHWGDFKCSLAVRSSGCSEDGNEASAAGQNQTFLGVVGRERLLEALAACWASLFSYHSVEYRRQHGQPVDSGMAVVVQEMVPAEAAGVVFTADPLTASPTTITITVNYGLGESVVSGSSEPDTVVVRRGWQPGVLTLASRTKGSKTTKCILKDGGGTEEVAVASSACAGEVLGVREAMRLARVADYLHDAFGTPRDIEFAMAKGVIYLVQSRPITTGEGWSDWELIHEQDNAILTDHEMLTRANTGEVLPGSTTPLSLSLILHHLDLTFQKDMRMLHWTCPIPTPHHLRLVAAHSTQVFLNMLEVQYRSVDSLEVSKAVQAGDFGIYGHKVATLEYLKWGVERYGFMGPGTKLLYLINFIYKRFANPGLIKKCRQQFGDFDVGSERAETAADLHVVLSRRFIDSQQVTHAHQATSMFSSVSQIAAFMTLASDNKEVIVDNVTDMATILSSCTGIESADVPNALKELAGVISKNEEAEEFLAMTSEEGAVWMTSHPGSLGSAFRAFIHRHGHRGINELDLGATSWRLEPQILVHTLQMMVQHQASLQPKVRPQKHDLEQAMDSLKSPLTTGIRRALRFLVPECRKAVVNREATKSLLCKVTDGLREGYRKLGQLLVREGRLPSADLVFFFKHSELGHLATSPSPALIAKARRRQRLYPQMDVLKFPEISIGIPQPVRSSSVRCEAAEEADGSRVLVGTPVCHGQVTAQVRVITQLQQAANIQRGEILVTGSTDVGWTPYFPLLAGVVTEIGGLISHGAVVAREYGLPCVVGLVSATDILNTGDRVHLDASKGTVTILPPTSTVNQ